MIGDLIRLYHAFKAGDKGGKETSIWMNSCNWLILGLLIVGFVFLDRLGVFGS